MSTNSLPFSEFESLLPKLLTVLELTQHPEGIATQEARQRLLQATKDFKASLNHAKELANALPGGELLIKEQDEVIAMLGRLRDRKREQLAQFSSREISASISVSQSMAIEVDSTASTPA
ncbi:hypothetical protein HETIRDRAFT_306333 [Heterobasidion irregulare TC 32-1]|uniref:Mediator of RNA polymerase II transcription subunit 9 n=1 Tax=Heterobasidion irregulare (strain TC 32-1) TaxID=747525 RepID=W4KPH5_HETIT|nr:uncharacterized protein HETIRDRAFT_306333 [Heterobasidion irregulare TC 32-1]ETW87748.1 hypothetical protein HETIRDRAFT_306333 [Heterobasidion irregulare TC 32-1]